MSEMYKLVSRARASCLRFHHLRTSVENEPDPVLDAERFRLRVCAECHMKLGLNGAQSDLHSKVGVEKDAGLCRVDVPSSSKLLDKDEATFQSSDNNAPTTICIVIGHASATVGAKAPSTKVNTDIRGGSTNRRKLSRISIGRAMSL